MDSFQALSYVFPLSPSLYLVQAPKQARFPYANGFLFTGNETVLLDAGIGQERIRQVDRVRRIDVLIISHSHPDHIHAWQTLADRHLLLPRETPDSAFDLHRLGHRFTGSLENGVYWADQMTDWLGLCPLREPEGRFGHDDVLELGGARLRAIHTPGHLADHYCFFEENSGTLLTTDVDFTGFGPWYANPEADINQFDADIQSLTDLPFSRLCSAHKPPILGGDKAPLEAFRRILCRQRGQILDLCRKPMTLNQMVEASPFYQNRFPDRRIQRIFETQLVEKNLQRLVEDGHVVFSRGTYQVTHPTSVDTGSGQENRTHADNV